MNTKNFSMQRMTAAILSEYAKTHGVTRIAQLDAARFVASQMRRQFYRPFIEALFLRWKQGDITCTEALKEIDRSLAVQSEYNNNASAVLTSLRRFAL